MSQPDDCVICKLVSRKIEVSVVHQNDLCSAFLDHQPVNPGHTLVVPNRHVGNLAELYEEEGAQMFHVAQRIAAALRKSGVKCEGVNVQLADGEAAGQEVFHTHLHVIPRYVGDGFGSTLGPHYGNKPERQELNEIADRIRNTLQSK
ncbi:MAG: HIT family protein [Chloracidobacterium sp.]|nr:HIT family protein [Chloracidobacterium sp.]